MASYSVRLRSGNKMPLLGLGTFMGGKSDKSAVKESVLKALEVGYRHIDAAYVYENESEIGEALQIAFNRKLVTREDVFITTKLPSNGHSSDKVEHYLKKSLEKLQLSYVDLYLIHFPVAYKYVNDELFWPKEGAWELDTETTQMDTWRAMEECVRAGLAKDIGLSNYNIKQIQHIYDNAKIKPANLQVECHLYMQQEKLFNFCIKLGISFTAYSPFGSPYLVPLQREFYKIDKPDNPCVLTESVILNIAKKYNKTAAQINLRWLIQRGIVPVPKSISPNRIEENFQVFDFLLTEEEMDSIKQMNRNLRFFKMDSKPIATEAPDYPFKGEF